MRAGGHLQIPDVPPRIHAETPGASSQAATEDPTATGVPFGSDSQVNADYRNLEGAVASGNVTSAQNALANLQSDLKAHHSKHHGAPPPSDLPATDSSASTSTSDSENTSGNFINVTV